MRPPIQASQDASSTPAQFRSGVDLVRIDIAALDGERRPVLGLTADDFVLRLDGKVEPIRAFAAVEVPPPPTTPIVRAPWTREIAPDVQSNTSPEDGRLVVIFFDRTIPPGPVLVTARKIAASVVSELGPNDLGALTSTRGSAAQNFTPDKALLLDAISRTTSGAAPGEVEASASAMALPASANAIFAAHEACYCNACVLEQLQAVADSLRNVSRRKVLIFIGSALTMDARDAGAPGGECEWPLKAARTKLLAALDRSHLVVNSFDPSGLATGGIGQAGSPLRAGQVRAGTNIIAAQQGQLRVLPDRTGGRAVVNTNMPQGLVANVLSESSAYYVIGFDAPSKPVNIDLRSNRRGVTVRTQRVYDPAPPASMVAPDPESTSSETAPVARSVSGTLPARGISLSASVLPMTLPGSDTSGVLVITDLAAGTGPRSSASEALPPRLDMIVSAFDQRARPQGEDRFSLEIPAASSRRSTQPFEVVTPLRLGPGRYEIRVGAASADGRLGSVSAYVTVPDFRKEPLALSGLGVTVAAAPGGVSIRDASEWTPFVPTIRRSFATAETIRAFLRVHEGGSAPLTPVDLQIRLLDTAGRVVLNTVTTLPVERFDANRSAGFVTDLPLRSTAPGEYLLTIGAFGGEHTARRDVRFTVER